MTEQAAPGASGPSVDADTHHEVDEPVCAEARALAADPHPDPAVHHEELVAVLRRALACGEPSAHALLANAHLDRGNRREAVEILTPAVMRGGRADLAGLLGETLAAVGDHESAEAAFLVGLDAGDPAAMNDYGVFLRERGRTQEALYVLDRAVRLGDDLAGLNLVALHLEELDDPLTATELAEDLLDEGRPATLVALADCRLAEGRVPEAEELYRRAADLGAPCAHIYLGWFLRDRREDLAGAEEQLRRAHEVGEPGAAFHLGRFLHDLGRREEAQPYLEEASWRGDPDAEALLEAEYRGLVDEYDD
ncbi:tetratricopeptide repeat protein [Actinomycetospora lemnae]|uniref:Tetratricopeptide repeat protein n=1 Tax=Actinomycetospora lemnae TaxID=3019891 RepID=A0ABT5SLS7_9PSEU|nr:tetratricopeptide repeat protein [Actinomycetospora sp. DW7H6]MDD7963795.1 tetratricopeptide repeat protein [Actinomycetospora sp. DW7H6]